MRKALAVLLCLALATAAITIIVLSSQRNGLTRELESAKRVSDTLRNTQTKYRAEAEEKIAALTEERDALAAGALVLEAEKETLAQEKGEMALALAQAKAEAAAYLDARNAAQQAMESAQSAMAQAGADWEARLASLSAEKEAAEERLNQVLAILLGTKEDPIPEDELTPVG